MKTRPLGRLLAAALLTAAVASALEAQEEPARLTLPPRQHLAAGVLTSISPDRHESDTMSGPRPLVEVIKGVDPRVLTWKPNYGAQTDTLGARTIRATIRSSVWYLEFSFKPLRMIYVNLPGPGGKFQRTPVWYIVYNVKNPGGHFDLSKGHFEVVEKDGEKTVDWVASPDKFGHSEFGADYVNRTVRFFPRFVLVAHDVKKKYVDQLVPVAMDDIKRREKIENLHDSVSISMQDIAVSDERIDRSVWGVAMWIDLDREIDFFSIYIQGLTNAYEFDDNPDAYTLTSPPLTGRKIKAKTLQLCFWRPGDEVLPTEREVHFGMPRLADERRDMEMLELYGVPQRTNYRWFYP